MYIRARNCARLTWHWFQSFHVYRILLFGKFAELWSSGRGTLVDTLLRLNDYYNSVGSTMVECQRANHRAISIVSVFLLVVVLTLLFRSGRAAF